MSFYIYRNTKEYNKLINRRDTTLAINVFKYRKEINDQTPIFEEIPEEQIALTNYSVNKIQDFLVELNSKSLLSNTSEVSIILTHLKDTPNAESSASLESHRNIISLPVSLFQTNEGKITASPMATELNQQISLGHLHLLEAADMNFKFTFMHELGHVVFNEVFKDTPVLKIIQKKHHKDSQLFTKWALNFSESFAESFALIKVRKCDGIGSKISTLTDVVHSSRLRNNDLLDKSQLNSRLPKIYSYHLDKIYNDFKTTLLKIQNTDDLIDTIKISLANSLEVLKEIKLDHPSQELDVLSVDLIKSRIEKIVNTDQDNPQQHKDIILERIKNIRNNGCNHEIFLPQVKTPKHNK